ncbi:DUF1330 domain-containing protein [Nocardia lijiangensis]|uniref:DUF1330 domain-containing protein n=1 Tax=Nocardia lijiangensis TaxID=299618 RepID=UPI0009FE86AE|nr:DUF1330 domain-containing protein [Nocardia lijiangensis]
MASPTCAPSTRSPRPTTWSAWRCWSGEARRGPDEAAVTAWSQSSEYQEISKDRNAGADTVTVLVKGLGHRPS